MELRSTVYSRLSDPTRKIHPLVGTVGFTLPDLEKLVWIEIEKDKLPWMQVFGSARENWVLCSPDFSPPQPLKIHLKPTSIFNAILIGNKTLTGGDFHLYGSSGLVILGENSLQFSPVYLRMWSDSQVFFFGKNSTTNGLHVHIQGGHKSIVVGDDCMFSSGINIRNSDMHSIVDMRTGAQKNPPGVILVEPHVWVGQDSLITRNTIIGCGSIVGAKSVVTRNVPRFASAAGVPARVVSTEVTWDRLETPRPETIADLRDLERSLASQSVVR